MNRATKKVMLFLLVSLMAVVLAQLVSAITDSAIVTLNVTDVRFSSGGALLQPYYSNNGGGFLLHNTTGGYSNFSGYLNGSSSPSSGNQYRINFTIRTNASVGIANITIALPGRVKFVPGSNITNSSVRGLINFSNSSLEGDQNISWTIATHVNQAFLVNVSTDVFFNFNVTINQTAGIDGGITLNFSINANTTTSRTLNYTVGNLTIDNTAPTFSSAKTQNNPAINTNLNINISFSEGLDASSIADADLLITKDNGDTDRAVTAINPSTGNSSSAALAMTQFNRSDTFNVTIEGTLTDLAGNNVTGTLRQNATDGVPPALIGNISTGDSVLNENNKVLVFFFNETINASSINLSLINLTANASDYAAFKNFRNLSGRVVSNRTVRYNNTFFEVNFTFTNADLDTIKGWRTASKNFSILADAVTDAAGVTNNNKIAEISSITFGSADTSNATINTTVNATYYDGNRTFTIFFNETIDASSIVASSITVINGTAAGNGIGYNISNLSSITLTGATVSMVNRSYVILNLTEQTAANISSWLRGQTKLASLYFSITNGSSGAVGTDVAGNNIIAITGSGAISNVTPFNTSSYSIDTNTPALVDITFNKTGNLPIVNAARLNITVFFNETMDVSTNVTLTVNGVTVDLEGGDAGQWQDNKTFAAAINITPNGAFIEGLNTVSVSGAKDISGLNTMTANTSRKVKADFTPPEMKAAWIDYWLRSTDGIANRNKVGNFSGTPLSNSTLKVYFTENVSIVTGQDNSLIFNLTSVGDNLSTASVLVAVDADNVSFINITMGNGSLAPTLTQRGVFDSMYNTTGAPSGISIMNNVIQDAAGNRAINSSTAATTQGSNITQNKTAVDIADNMITFVANVTKTFSVPFCVNTTLMSDQLGEVTGSCSSYTTGSFSTVSSGALLPLKSYQCTFTAGNLPMRLRIYTLNQSKCTLQSTTASLTEGFNLIAVDGHNQTSASTLFASLNNGQGAASSVTRMYLDTDGTLDIVNNGNLGAVGSYLSPYQGYWIFVNQNDVYAGNGLN